MRRATLLYNPLAGAAHERRMAAVEMAAEVLRANGVGVAIEPTESAESTGQQARQAALGGSDVVFACGGDGTIHDVLQGMVGAPNGCALGLIPLGTANALAYDLGIPSRPDEAAKVALKLAPKRIPVGKMEFTTPTGETAAHYFTVMAGAGADGALLYRMNMKLKRRFGMSAYYLHAAILAASHSFAPFAVEFTDKSTGGVRREIVAQAMAVRIGDFGNVLRRLAQGATLEREDLRIALFKPPIRISLGMHLSTNLFGRSWRMPGVELVETAEISCHYLSESSRKIYAEADGELLGTVPVRFSALPNAFTLLMPPHRQGCSQIFTMS